MKEEIVNSILDLLIGLKVILLGPDTNSELPPETFPYSAMINMYVTLDCNSIVILNSSLGQPLRLRAINLSSDVYSLKCSLYK